MQRSCSGCLRQAVAIKGVMVQTNRFIAIGAKLISGYLKHGKSLPGAGQISRFYFALER